MWRSMGVDRGSRVLGWRCDGDGRCGDGLHRRRMPPATGGEGGWIWRVARWAMCDERMGGGRCGDGRRLMSGDARMGG
jgi:hypothetical protein